MNINALKTGNTEYTKANISSKYNQDLKSKDNSSANQVTKRTDKLELSEEAKKLIPIRKRISDGYYDKPEVLREVAQRISIQFDSAK